MLQDFIRLVIYVPIDETDLHAVHDIESATSVKAILRIMREFDFVGNVGTYKDVIEISSGLETFMPTSTSSPTRGIPDARSSVPSARLVTYIPSITSDEELNRVVDTIAATHPWEHPVLEVDQVSLWVPV